MLTVYPTDTMPLATGLTAGTYNGWCGTSTGETPLEAPQAYAAYTSSAALPSPFYPGTLPFQATWDEINYILNHKDHVYKGTAASVSDIQTAIWGAVSYYQGSYYFQSLDSLQLQPVGFDLFQEAVNYVNANGTYVVPPGGVRMMLLVAPTPSNPISQHMVVEVPNCPSLGDRVWNDVNGDGLQNITQVNLGRTLSSYDYTKYFGLSYSSASGSYSAYQLSASEPGISGVTVNLYNVVPTTPGAQPIATTITGATPFGYPNLPQSSPGYYQFKGMCPGTYYVTIPNYSTPGQQAALAGLNYTTVHVGNSGSVGNDSGNPAGEQATISNYNALFPLETLDFGFTGLPPMALSCSNDTAFDSTYYDSFFAATGGQGPYTYSISSGSLPSWASLNTSTGEVTGTPPSATAGVSTFTVTAVDTRGATAGSVSSNCSITTKTQPSINCPSTIGTAGVPYSSALVASGGSGNYTYSWSSPMLDSNNRLDGLTLNPQTGAITGIPPLAGTFPFNATVMDGSGSTASSGSSSCNIQPAIGLTCGAATPSTGEVGAAFSVAAPTLTGGVAPYTFTVVNATNSPSNMGLTVNADGSVSSNSANGPAQAGSFSIQIADHNGLKAPGTCPVTVIAPPTMTCAATNAAGEVGVAFTAAKPTVTGGTGPYTFKAVPSGNSPSLASIGLALASDGSVSALAGFTAPSGAGSYNIQVTDSLGVSAAASCPITINPAVSASCSANPYVGDQGQAFSLAAPTISGLGTLLNGAGFTFQAIGSNGSAISPAALAAMGITFDTTTGKVSSANGPTAPVSFTIQVSDSLATVAATGCSVNVHATPALACGVSNPVTGEVGLGYSTTMTVSGGTAPFTFTPSSPSTLSAMGLAASPASPTSNATLTVATPANQAVQQAGTVTFQVTDNAGVTATQSCPVAAVAKPVLTCGTVNGQGTVNQQFTSPALTGSVSLGSGAFQFSAVDANGNPLAQPLLGGLTLNTSTGAITGVPTAAGGFFIKVADGNGVAASNTCAVQIAATPVLTVSKTSGSFQMGGQASFTITVSNSAATGSASATGVALNDNLPTANGLTWANATASNNAACNISNGNQLSCALGTIAAGGAVSVTVTTPGSTPPAACTQQVNLAAIVTASNAASPNPASGTLTCAPPPLTLTCPAGTASAGVAYSSSAGGAGGVPPYTFSLASGSLPAGLTLNPTTGQITGTPTAGGTYNFQVQIKDAQGTTTTGSGCGITVAWPPITATCVTIQAVQGSPITPVKMTATGGTGTGYIFSATGLPAGLGMASDGTISGTPTVSGTVSYTVTVKDGSGNTGTVNCSVTVNPTPTASCVTINAVQGTPITPVTMTGSGGAGGPYTFSATGLPAGLTMASSGTVSGTPTVSGTFSYTVTVKDSSGNIGTVNCSVTVKPTPTASCVTITDVQGVAITPVSMTGSGGVGGPYTFSATGLPAGLTMASNGTISGTPTVSGTFGYTVTVKDSSGNIGTVNCSVTVNPTPTASCVTINAVQGVAITPVTMIGSGGVGGPYTYTAAGLPAGLTMASSGTISGTPTVSGTFGYTVTVKDSAGNTGTVNCSVTVNPTPTASCVTINAVQGVAIAPVTMTGSGGVGGPYTFSATGLPAGLTMASNGTISGTPTVSGTFGYTVTVKDSAGNAGTVNCSVTVAPPVIALTISCPAGTGTVGVPYSSSAPVTGGVGTLTFSVASGTLPSGLTLNPSTGAITGTPTVGGTYSFTLQVQDSGTGNKATSSSCGITISSPSSQICGGDTATIGFWHNQNGQALINAVNGGGTSTALSSWLVQQFPTLFGSTGTYKLTGDTNAQVASVYMTVFANDKTFAQIFAGALAAYVTNSGLAGGNYAGPYGFNYAAGGTAGKTWNVGTSGSGIGLSNNTSYTLMQILQAANQAQSTSPDSNAANVIFSAINMGGDIGTSGCGGMTPLTMSCAAGSAVVGVPYSSAVTASGGVGAYTFTLFSGSLPPGLSLSSNGTIAGTPTGTGGTYSYVVQVTDSQGNTAQTTGCSITVAPAVTANCASITAMQGAAITPVTMAASGGTGTGYTFSATGLPAGLTMSAGGTISGTPTVSGTFGYTVTVKDSAGNTGTVSCSVTVSPQVICSPSSVDLTGGNSASTGTAGNIRTFASSNGVQVHVSAWSRNKTTGAWSPAWLGSYSPGLGVTNHTQDGSDPTHRVDNSGAEVDYVLFEFASPVVVDKVYLNYVYGDSDMTAWIGNANTPFTNHQTLSDAFLSGLADHEDNAGGSAARWADINSGSLSANILVVAASTLAGNSNDYFKLATLNLSCGGTTGTPTASCVTVNAVQGVAITPVTLVGKGGTGSGYTFTATGLPAGLTMSGTGTISGTPTVSGTFSYTVTIKDSAGNTGTLSCSLTVNTAPTATCVTISAIQGVAIPSVTMTGSGGMGAPYTFSATGLPAGLSMSSSGTISGTSTVSGTFSYTVTVKDSAGNTGTVNCSVTVAAPVSATCATVTAVKGTSITPATMTGSGGMGAPYTFTATGLPSGLTMSSGGTISGTPTVSGTFSYTVTVTDKSGNSGTVNCSVTVAAAPVPLALSCPSSATGTVGSAYSASVAASGGTGPYSYSLASGALPPGLTLNTSTGAIAGSPTTGGNFAFSIRVTDSKGATALSSCATSCGGTVTWNLVNPVGNVGTSQPYTVNNLTVTAYGYTGTTNGTAASLYANDSGGDLYGLGIVGSANNQIDAGHFVTLDISAINAAGGSNAQITIAGASNTDTFTVYGSNTLGSIGTALISGGAANDLVPLTITNASSYKYLSVRATAGAVLVEAISFSLGNCNITIGGTSIVFGDAATIGFWHNKNGQALINAMPSSPALGNWLANNFPYLYGPSGSNNLTNASNATVANLFMTLFGNDKTGAQIMAGALASYVTSTSLAGTGAINCGFNSSVQGTGGKLYNVGSSGSAIGLSNSTNYTVMQLLLQVNLAKANGAYSSQANSFNVIFSGINQTGDIQ
jgi:hypothetical protein